MGLTSIPFFLRACFCFRLFLALFGTIFLIQNYYQSLGKNRSLEEGEYLPLVYMLLLNCT